MKELVFFGEEAGFFVEQKTLRGKWWEILSINTLYISKWIFRRPMIFKKYFDEKLDVEYNNTNGFAGAFIKYK